MSPFIYPLKRVTTFEDEIVNDKAFEHASLIFTEPWVLTNKIMLNIMESLKFDFLNKFWASWGVRFNSISRTLAKNSGVYFTKYKGILELKSDTRISRKNGWFVSKTCCGLTALFVKTKIYFCCWNFVNKKINKIPSIVFCVGCGQ